MEDQVPFKVYTYWDDDSKAEVRRFGVEKSTVTSFHYLNAKLHDVFPGLKTKTYSVTWKDEEEDNITISSDEEMVTALSALCGNGNLIKLNVYVKDTEEKDDDCDIVITAVTDNPTVGPSNLPHYGVTCDGCNSPVVGFRYKCTSCQDFDLCSKCESSGIHPQHCMVRVPSPVMPRALIKAAIKKSRHFLKSVAGNMCEEGGHHKRHRRDRSGDRRHHSAEHHRGEHHRGEHHHRRPRHSWLDTFATYMNEFANLAGDIPQPQEPENKETKTDNAQPQQSEAATSTGDNPQTVPVLAGVENIPKLVEMCFNGTLVKHLAQQIPTNPTETSQTAPSNSDVTSSNSNTEDVEMADGAKNTQEKEKESTPPEASPSTSSENRRDSSPDSSPDKVDGWTLINKEKDLMDAMDKPSAPAEPTVPVGFNLPKEFQTHVNVNDAPNAPIQPTLVTAVPEQPKPPQPPTGPHPVAQSSIYPWVQFPQSQSFAQSIWAPPSQQSAPAPILAPQPVPILTPQPVPILTPQPVPTMAPQPVPTMAPQPVPTMAQAKPAPAPLPQPKSYHPKPHIDIAIKHMLAMGFTNEGGWLTQLLESKDGNIAAVLDLLTPVNPRKPH